MKQYRGFRTVGELQSKRKDKWTVFSGIAAVFVLFAILTGLGYLDSPSAELWEQTALHGISYRSLIVLVLISMGSLFGMIGLLLLADRYKKIGYHVKIALFSFVCGLLCGGTGVNLLLNLNRLLADKSSIQKKYKVTGINFQRKNRTVLFVPNLLLDCRILEAVSTDNPEEKLYFHVPTNTQAAIGCTLHTTVRNGIFGWKVVEHIGYNCKEVYP